MARAARAAYFRKCTNAARDIQRIYRGRKGRLMYRALLKASQQLAVAKVEQSFVINVRCAWRVSYLFCFVVFVLFFVCLFYFVLFVCFALFICLLSSHGGDDVTEVCSV